MNIVLPVPTTDFERELIQALTDYFNNLEDGVTEARRPNIKNITANYTVLVDDHTILVDATAGAVTLTLPVAVKSSRRTVSVKKTDASVNNVVLIAASGDLIDGAATSSLTTQYESITVHSDGVGWWVI